MGISLTTRQAYSEIDEFLSLLNKEQREKIPQKLRALFKEEKDKSYIKGIKKDISVKEQNLKEETLAIIALLNLEYWCEDENEKQRLKEVYLKNEQMHKELLQVAFDSDEVFKKSKINIEKEDVKEGNQMIEYKESILKRIINKIKSFLCNKK